MTVQYRFHQKFASLFELPDHHLGLRIPLPSRFQYSKSQLLYRYLSPQVIGPIRPVRVVLGGLPFRGETQISYTPDNYTEQGVWYAFVPFMQKTGISSEGLFYVYRPIKNTSDVHNTCCLQIFISYNGGLFKRRIYNWDSQIWTEWKDL